MIEDCIHRGFDPLCARCAKKKEKGPKRKRRKMNFKEFFNPPTMIEYTFNEKIVRHYFIEMDSEIDLAYQRTLVHGSRLALNKNQIPNSSLQAEIWLYNKLCQKVELQNGDSFVEVPNFREVINPTMKRRAVFDYQRRIAEVTKEEGSGGNS